jgi:hypothetical protein
MPVDAGGANNLPRNEKELIKSGIPNQAGFDSIIMCDAAVIKFFPSKGKDDPLQGGIFRPGIAAMLDVPPDLPTRKHQFSRQP